MWYTKHYADCCLEKFAKTLDAKRWSVSIVKIQTDQYKVVFKHKRIKNLTIESSPFDSYWQVYYLCGTIQFYVYAKTPFGVVKKLFATAYNTQRKLQLFTDLL